jgi:hypothetical protein
LACDPDRTGVAQIVDVVGRDPALDATRRAQVALDRQTLRQLAGQKEIDGADRASMLGSGAPSTF